MATAFTSRGGSRGFGLTIDVTATEAMAGKVAKITGEILGRVSRDSVNTIANSVYELGRNRVGERVNLSPAYVNDKFRLELAKPNGVAEASITATGNLTVLGRFPWTPIIVPIKNPAMAHLRKGNSRYHIAPGQKLGGIKVNITAGSSPFTHGFMVPLRNQNGLMGLFTRDASSPSAAGKRNPKDGPPYSFIGTKHRYGPAVYSLFRQYLDKDLTKIDDMLADEVLKNLDVEIEKAF